MLSRRVDGVACCPVASMASRAAWKGVRLLLWLWVRVPLQASRYVVVWTSSVRSVISAAPMMNTAPARPFCELKFSWLAARETLAARRACLLEAVAAQLLGCTRIGGLQGSLVDHIAVSVRTDSSPCAPAAREPAEASSCKKRRARDAPLRRCEIPPARNDRAVRFPASAPQKRVRACRDRSAN